MTFPFFIQKILEVVLQCFIQKSTSSPPEFADFPESQLPHGLWFCEVYGLLRKQFGYIHKSKPLYGQLTTEQKARVHHWKQIPKDVLQALENPTEYRNQQKRRSQQRIRAARKNAAPKDR